MKYLFIYCIKAYQLIISPLLPSSCRFYPTCSEYSVQAFQAYGVFRGLWMTLVRILKCHPFHPGGYDPVIRDEDGSEPSVTGNRIHKH
jgi:uncharacterized protein